MSLPLFALMHTTHWRSGGICVSEGSSHAGMHMPLPGRRHGMQRAVASMRGRPPRLLSPGPRRLSRLLPRGHHKIQSGEIPLLRSPVAAFVYVRTMEVSQWFSSFRGGPEIPAATLGLWGADYSGVEVRLYGTWRVWARCRWVLAVQVHEQFLDPVGAGMKGSSVVFCV